MTHKEAHQKKNWFSQHADTIAVIGSILGAIMWMNSQFNGIQKDLAVIKTVLIMKQIMPCELAKDHPKED